MPDERSIEPVEIEWLAWVVGDPATARLAGRVALGFDELVAAAEAHIHANLEKQAALPAVLRNAHSLSQQYGFDAATLPDRLLGLDTAERAQVLDQVEAQR
jgi:hypothetical protein